MGDLVNLNKYRKKKARAEKEKRAEHNRLKHSMSDAERALLERKRELDARRLEGHKLDRDEQ